METEESLCAHVSSSSQYDIQNGPLTIREDETFFDFYRQVVACRPIHMSLAPLGRPRTVVPAAASISIECGGFRVNISFPCACRVAVCNRPAIPFLPRPTALGLHKG